MTSHLPPEPTLAPPTVVSPSPTASSVLRLPAAIQACASGATLSAIVFLPTLADELGGTDWQIGLLATGYSFAGFLSFLIFGRASDVHGRRPFIRWGLGLSTLIFALLYLVTEVRTLFLLRVLGGFTAGLFPAALIAYVHESRARLARFTAYGTLGWGLGTFISGIVAALWDLKAPFLLSAGLFGGAFLISCRLPPVKSRRLKVPLFPLQLMRRNRLVFGGLLIRHAGAHGVWAFWPLYLATKGADEFWIGCIMAANTLFQFTVMYLVADRVPPTRAFPAGLALSALTFAVFLVAPDYRYILAAQSLLGTAWALTYVGGLRYVTEQNVERATASGLLHATMGLAGILGPALAGAAMVLLGGGYRTVLYLAVLLSLCGTLIALPLSRQGAPSPST